MWSFPFKIPLSVTASYRNTMGFGNFQGFAEITVAVSELLFLMEIILRKIDFNDFFGVYHDGTQSQEFRSKIDSFSASLGPNAQP